MERNSLERRKQNERERNHNCHSGSGMYAFGVRCGKAKLNDQIAEAIGTTGMYENNEPVDSRKMKAHKQLQKIEEKKKLFWQRLEMLRNISISWIMKRQWKL